MTSIEVLRPYVDQKVAEYLGVEKVQKDDDGDIPIRQGSVAYFVRLLEGPSGPMLRVFSPLLRNVEKKPELLDRLNELNGSTPYVRLVGPRSWVHPL
jgi:hypothetical protein